MGHYDDIMERMEEEEKSDPKYLFSKVVKDTIVSNKEKPTTRIFGLTWENVSCGVWLSKDTYIRAGVRILSDGLFTYSLNGREEVGDYLTLEEGCREAALAMVQLLEFQISIIKAAWPEGTNDSNKKLL